MNEFFKKLNILWPICWRLRQATFFITRDQTPSDKFEIALKAVDRVYYTQCRREKTFKKLFKLNSLAGWFLIIFIQLSLLNPNLI